MKTKFNTIFSGLVLLAVVPGCDSGAPSIHEDSMVVESYLVAEAPLPPVWVSQSQDINAVYSLERTAIDEAHVVISRIDASGAVLDTFPYERSPTPGGMFISTREHTVLPGARYRLEVGGVPDLTAIAAETLVPEAFELIESSHTAIEYQDPAQYSMLITQPSRLDRQNIFIFTLESEDPSVANLTPPYFQFFFDGEDPDNREGLQWKEGDQDDLRKFSSQPVNEGNYEVYSDGTLRVKLPWFAVAFFGKLRVTVSALDDNLYDFRRYQDAQQGGPLLSPGDIPNVLDPVQGGHGIFGSLARVTAEVTILNKPN